MASELRVNTLKDASGNNSIGMSYVAEGSAKAWVNYNGSGTLAVRDSFNTSSVTDVNTGLYKQDYTNSMNNNDYHVSMMLIMDYGVNSFGGAGGVDSNDGDDGILTGSVTMSYLRADTGITVDAELGGASILGDLA
jgi:hypothetical protein